MEDVDTAVKMSFGRRLPVTGSAGDSGPGWGGHVPRRLQVPHEGPVLREEAVSSAGGGCESGVARGQMRERTVRTPAGGLAPAGGGPGAGADRISQARPDEGGQMSGPLEGVKVVELSTWAAVPCAGQLMGDWGADVIKIEHPEGGDPTRGWAGPGWLPPSSPAGVGWIADNRSKRSIALDLSKEAGQRSSPQAGQGSRRLCLQPAGRLPGENRHGLRDAGRGQSQIDICPLDWIRQKGPDAGETGIRPFRLLGQLRHNVPHR